MNISVLGIDLAKNIFQIHGVDARGNKVINKAISRNKLIDFMAQLKPCLVGMEACGGSNYWGQVFTNMGHEVKLMNPKFVKAYVKSNKNDKVDAEAICEAVDRPNMRFVAIKNKEQQDIQSIHKIRARLVKERTAIANEARGLLHEYGIIITQGISRLMKELPEIVSKDNGLTERGREIFTDLYRQLKSVDKKVEEYDKKIETIGTSNAMCKMLMKLPGVGVLTATAVIAMVGNVKLFKNGRELSAYLGLVPRQHSSGGKERLLGISKRGDRYIRCLLIHGARAALFRAKSFSKERTVWLTKLKERRGINRATVALANKNTRLIWAIMTKGEEFNWKMGISKGVEGCC